ncbi:MAG: cellulase family glycosylhydrolase, partial [Anaerolineae bacterium]|nr:cellulase family glycosylhydrolase [Anaerolineae bacterium]
DNSNFINNADNLLNDLRKHGTENVLLKLIVWSEGGLPDAPRDSEEVKDYAENAAEVAEFIRNRHGSSFNAIAYEIWNEPNLNFEWEGNPNPGEFVKLLRAASTAIRAADPQAIIVSGAPSPGGDYDDLKFLDAMYANGAKGLMDAVGSHPYGGPFPPEHPDGIDPQGNGYPYFRKPEAQRAIMEKYGDTETDIWATEFSWLAGLPGCNFGEHTPWQVTVEQQTDYLVTAYRYAHHNWPWMGPMFVVFDFGLTGRYDRCHPAGGYSILRPEPGSDNIVSPAAQALFDMEKFSAW